MVVSFCELSVFWEIWFFWQFNFDSVLSAFWVKEVILIWAFRIYFP